MQIKMGKRYLLILYSFLVGICTASGQAIPERPSPQKLVNNLSAKAPDFLSGTEQNELESKLADFSNRSSNQIAVVIIDDLNGMDVADYATQLGNNGKWVRRNLTMVWYCLLLTQPVVQGREMFT